MDTRRNFLKSASSFLGAALSSGVVPVPAQTAQLSNPSETKRVSFNGLWQFRLDPDRVGQANAWYKPAQVADGWQNVTVPHTWQTAQDSAEYFGVAWYRRTLEVPAEWSDRTVRVEFEAVFHSASVWVNGTKVGDHPRKGYTAFNFEIARHLHPVALR